MWTRSRPWFVVSLAEQAEVFGEFPVFEPGHYTFLLDLAEWGDSDAMEHRNSTSIAIPGLPIQTPDGRRLALSIIAHESFHVWNVERIRPADLEPFVFTRANVSCCLWFAEGFTDYYGGVSLARAGLADQAPVSSVANVANRSGRLVRSPRPDERARAVYRSRGVERHDGFGPQLRLVLPIRRGDRPRIGLVTARPIRRTSLARRLHAASVAGVRACGWSSAGICRPAVHARGLAGHARRGVGRPTFRRRVLRPLHRGPRLARLRGLAVTSGLRAPIDGAWSRMDWRCAGRAGGRRDSPSDTAAVAGRSCRSARRSTRRASISTT